MLKIIFQKGAKMPLYESSQSFNDASAKMFSKVDTDAVTMQGIVDMMPDGQTVFAPTLTGAVGTARAVPTSHVSALISCFDKTDDGAYNVAYIGLKYGKPTLSHTDMISACISKVEVPNGTSCDSVNVSKIKRVG